MNLLRKLSVLVVDANVVYRRLLTKSLESMDEVGAVNATFDGKTALARLKQSPADMVLFDLDLEYERGLNQIRQMHETHPEVMVMALCSRSDDCAVKVIGAMQAGALELVYKPPQKLGPGGMRDFNRELKTLLGSIHGRQAAVRAKRIVKQPPASALGDGDMPAMSQPGGRPLWPLPSGTAGSFDVVAIGVSTGGPNSLQQIIPRLPPNLGVPMLLVQHMPPDFTHALAESLASHSAIAVKEAAGREVVKPNVVYLAPGGRHMEVVKAKSAPLGMIRLNDAPPVNSCRPSADVLLASLSEVFGSRVLAVIMTGMGNDGRRGVEAVKAKGGYCISQTEDTCVVYGMPRAVDEAGLSDERVPLDRIAERIVYLVTGRALEQGS